MGRGAARLGILIVAGLWLTLRGATALGAPQGPPSLRRAIAFFNAGEDLKAERALKLFLTTHAKAEDLANAHIYLGLLALNALGTAEAQREFTAALETDLVVELPYEASPKAEALFDQTRAQVRAKNQALAATPAATPPPAPTAAPPPLVVVQPEPGPPPPAPSHVLSLTVGGVAVATGIAGLVFEGLSASSLSSARNNGYAPAALGQAQTSATEQDLANWLLVGAGGALVAAAVVFAVEELSGNGPAASAASAARSALPGGLSF